MIHPLPALAHDAEVNLGNDGPREVYNEFRPESDDDRKFKIWLEQRRKYRTFGLELRMKMMDVASSGVKQTHLSTMLDVLSGFYFYVNYFSKVMPICLIGVEAFAWDNFLEKALTAPITRDAFRDLHKHFKSWKQRVLKLFQSNNWKEVRDSVKRELAEDANVQYLIKQKGCLFVDITVLPIFPRHMLTRSGEFPALDQQRLMQELKEAAAFDAGLVEELKDMQQDRKEEYQIAMEIVKLSRKSLSSSVASSADRLRALAPRIRFVTSSLESAWDGMAPRRNRFVTKLWTGKLDSELLTCCSVEDAIQLEEVIRERKLCGLVRDLNAFVKGRVNSNELKIPAVCNFLHQLRLGKLDSTLCTKNPEISWGEADFVKESIGSILAASRQYAISNEVHQRPMSAVLADPEFSREVSTQVELKRQALEADLERRVRQRTDELQDRARKAEDSPQEVKTQTNREMDSLRQLLEKEKAEKEDLAKTLNGARRHLSDKEQELSVLRAALSDSRKEASHEQGLRISTERQIAYYQGMHLEQASLDDLDALEEALRLAQARKHAEMARRLRVGSSATAVSITK